MGFVDSYMVQVKEICDRLDMDRIAEMVAALRALRERGGRLFVLGVGGSAANAAHAVNDFRKLCNIAAYAPTDNVPELTARTNDEGWASVFEAWLRTSQLNNKDALLVFSVGGGDLERNVSPNLVHALELARDRGATILGIVGRDGGFTAQVGDPVVVIPVVDGALVTPHSEAFQAIVWHCLVSHPDLQTGKTKW